MKQNKTAMYTHRLTEVTLTSIHSMAIVFGQEDYNLQYRTYIHSADVTGARG